VKVEGFNFEARKRVVEYDDVMNKQREIIYGKRQQILTADKKEDLKLKEEIQEKINFYLQNLVNSFWTEERSQEETSQIVNGFCEILPVDPGSQEQIKKQISSLEDVQKITDFLNQIIKEAYESREKQVGGEIMREIEKFVWLQSIDRLWIDHLDAMDNLREGVGLRGYGQQDPLVEYKKEGFASFEKLIGMIEDEVIRRLFRVQVANQPTMPQRVQTNVDTQDGMGLRNKAASAVKPVTSSKETLGRNDPCWCGSGKKWKKCHYPNLS
jgi:preprotein translocase subunit SecA